MRSTPWAVAGLSLLAILAFGCGVTTGLDPDATPTPSGNPSPTPTGSVSITGTSYDLLALGAGFSITGTGLDDVQAVRLGGVDQPDFTIDSESALTVRTLAIVTPLGAQDLEVVSTDNTVATYPVDVVSVSVEPALPVVGVELTVTLSSFPGFDSGAATIVSVGSVEQGVAVAGASEIVTDAIDLTTPLGDQPIVISNGATTVTPVSRTVLAVAINELDASTPGTDAAEFVEISTGVAGVSLDGFFLVFYNANLSDQSYRTIDLGSAAVTDDNGLFLTGNPALSPDISFPNNTLQNGADAVGLYYGDPSAFPNGTVANANGLVDALVYDSADPDPTSLLMALFGAAGASVDEAANGDPDNESISRCENGLLSIDGSVWNVGTPTPGQPNTCP